MKVQIRKGGRLLKSFFLLAFMLSTAIAFAQTRVSGTVTDVEGEPLAGVTVMEKGTSNGTATDIDGQYTLNVKNGAVLTFNYIGYMPQEVAVTGSTLNVVLKEDKKLLDEVVVVGYGTMTRKDVTSSITTVRKEDLNTGAFTSPAQLLQGKVPGLTIVGSSDPNNGTPSVTLRGASTLRGATAPLYVIDGIADANLDLISPEDIESIDVLRDASATAIYGSKAANGVIMITTKQGSKDQQRVTYSAYVSFEKIMKHLDVMTADQMRAYAKEHNFDLVDDLGANTNWADEVSRTGFAHNHNLSISGGKGNTNYVASINYMERDGVIRGTGNNRLNVRSMVSGTALKDRVTFTLGINGAVNNSWGVRAKTSGTEGGQSVFDAMYYYSPTVPVRNEDGSWFDNSGYVSQSYNPMSMINEIDARTTYKFLQAMGKVSIKIIDGLLLNGNFNYQNDNWAYKTYESSKNQFNDMNGWAHRNTSEGINKSMEIYANYDKTFGQNKIALMAGYSWEEHNTGDGFGGETYNFYDDTLGWNNIGLGNSKNIDCIWGNTASVKRMISFYGRANYSFASKYILQAAVRRDGASVFGSNNRWATFPSVSAAWRLSEENFIKSLGIFDDLKIRAGYGESGNSAGFDVFTSRFFYTASGWFDYTDPVTGKTSQYHQLSAARNANPDLKWETTSMLNIGLDFAFLNGRINGTLEFYNKKTKDMIYGYAVPTNRYPVGWMDANVGSMQNRGVELTINAVPVQTRDWNWSTSLNLSHNANKLVKLSNAKYSVDYIDLAQPDVAGKATTVQRIMEGEPIGTFYLWEWAGYDETDHSIYYKRDEDGNRMKNPDGSWATTDDPTNQDRYKAGCAQPKLVLGWNNTVNYKNWSMNVFFTGMFGHKIYNEVGSYYSNTTLVKTGKNCLANVVSKQRYNDTHAQWPSDRYLENGSYLRLSSLTLAYTFRNCFNGWLKDLKLHATCNNVFTITSYSGRDPEISLGGLEPGMDLRKTQYPRTRSFLFGATINF